MTTRRYLVCSELLKGTTEWRASIFYLQVAYVVNEHARICAPVECHTQTLESLLPCGVPNLGGCERVNREYVCVLTFDGGCHFCHATYLHGDQFIINHDFLGQKIGANGGFVLICKFLRYILIHQRSFSNPVVVGIHIYMICAANTCEGAIIIGKLTELTITVKAKRTRYPRG